MAKRNYFAAAAYVLSFKERNLPVITPYKASLPLHTDKAVKYIFSLSLFMSHTEVSWDEAVIKIQCQEKVGKICFKLSTIKKKKKKTKVSSCSFCSVFCYILMSFVLHNRHFCSLHSATYTALGSFYNEFCFCLYIQSIEPVTMLKYKIQTDRTTHRQIQKQLFFIKRQGFQAVGQEASSSAFQHFYLIAAIMRFCAALWYTRESYRIQCKVYSKATEWQKVSKNATQGRSFTR